MKRYINKIFILFTAICLLTGLLTGCTTRKNVIPKKLGTQEGLWLYYKDKRSRTDGTQKQNILQTVEFAEKSYDKDSFKVKSQVYLTNIKTIVFWLSVYDEAKEIENEGDGEIEESEGEGEEEANKEKTETQILYRYSYKEKTGEVLYTLPATSDIDMYLSDSYLFVKAYNFGILFNTSLELIGDDFANYTLSNDILYRCTKTIKDENRSTEAWKLEWYQDEVWNSVWLNHVRNDESYKFYYAGDYLYVFNYNNSLYDSSYYKQYINLKTSEQAECSEWVNQAFVLNNEFFICAYNTGTSNPNLYTLYRVEGMKFTPVYTFKADLSLYIGEYCRDADYYYLEAKDYRNNESTYYKMDRRTNEIKKSKQLKETKRCYFEITVGEYTFYQNERHYRNFIFGENCVYLYREKNGKKEAMQYKLSEDLKGFRAKYDISSRLFYNDICDF